MNQAIKSTYFDRKLREGKIMQQGQALITLLFFIVLALTVTSAAVVVLAANSISTSKLEQGTVARYAAESGAENAMLQLLRNPNYTGEVMQIDSASVSAQVTQGTPITILSTAQDGNFVRKVQIQATYTNNILTISSWKEVY